MARRLFETLLKKLTPAPILVYPNFDLAFVLETDESVKGLGVVLYQCQEDGTAPSRGFCEPSLVQATRQ